MNDIFENKLKFCRPSVLPEPKSHVFFDAHRVIMLYMPERFDRTHERRQL